MDNVKNMRELSELPLEDIQKLIGTENGRLLYNFFRLDLSKDSIGMNIQDTESTSNTA